MTVCFDHDAFEKMRLRLLGEEADALVDFMSRKQLGEDVGQVSEETIRIAKEVGWIDHSSGQFTLLGQHAADSCREYRFWLERDKALPFEGAVEHLSLNYFAGKSVVEIGCGMGAHLMSMSAVVGDLVGIEPIEAYVQFGSIVREREGIPKLDVRIGTAEALPLDNDRFDIVICRAAHHYFDIVPALKEFARVLKPGGELLIIGDTWDVEAGLILKEMLLAPSFMKRISLMKRLMIDTTNTLSYTAFQRRIFAIKGKPVSRPIFPLRRTMTRWIEDVGLTLDRPLARIGPDTCFASRKNFAAPSGRAMSAAPANRR